MMACFEVTMVSVSTYSMKLAHIDASQPCVGVQSVKATMFTEIIDEWSVGSTTVSNVTRVSKTSQ